MASTAVWNSTSDKIQSLAILVERCAAALDLPRVATCSAVRYLHIYSLECNLLANAQEFLTTLNSNNFPQNELAMAVAASLLLSTKNEEVPTRVRDIINVVFAALSDNAQNLPANVYFKAKQNVLLFEQRLLRVLGFKIDTFHPQHYVLHFVRILETSDEVAKLSFAIANDSFRTGIGLMYASEKIACACIFLAGKLLSDNSPWRPPMRVPYLSDVDPRIANPMHEGSDNIEWYESFGCSRNELENICDRLCDLLEQL